MMKISKIDRLYKVLATGKAFTPKQLRKRTGLGSVSAAVRDLRRDGFDIDMNRINEVNKYQMVA